ncbi:protein-disulfide reductase DsbD [Zobellella sp. DQSA1]|uniref:protein-disulfide reductase DsbD n=1 Tax=Zobellella sp. DQSA1 TaxID=3342386 RepID=UPI0035BFD671
MSRILCLLLACCLPLAPAHAGLLERLGLGQDRAPASAFLRVEQAFAVSSRQTPDALQITVSIAPGYYLYRHSISVTPVQATFGDWSLPEGRPHEDEYFGQSQVYYQQLQLQIPLEQFEPGGRAELRYQGCTAGLCYPPERLEIPLTSAAGELLPAPAGQPMNEPPLSSQERFAAGLAAQGHWLSLGLFFVLGLGLAFTPCVFPMYPIVTALIAGAGQVGTGRSLWLAFAYVQGMALTYTLLGLVVASVGMQAQALMQHPAVLATLALLFGLLALAMFGWFELRLPGRLQSRLALLANRHRAGSTPGVVLMGMISGLVCSPCTTAPLSGALLYVAQSGDLLLGGLALYALSLGMGLPLLLLAAGSGKLLPKAGIWMEQVKILFGFGLLAVAIIMLERWLTDGQSRWLWLLLGTGMVGYYYRHHRRLPRAAWRRFAAAALVTAGGLLLLGGWQQLSQADKAEHPDFIQVKTPDELSRQLATASAEGKAVMLDLYADWCVACKDFEQKTFPQPQVKQRLDQMLLLQADVTATDADDIALLNQLGVMGLPTLIFYDQAGTEPAGSRVTGFMDAAPFHQHLSLLRLDGG